MAQSVLSGLNSPMSSEKLRILPLGGLGEIGMNCMAIEWKDTIVLLDCGIQFPDANHPGVDLLLPDMGYLRERLDKIKAVVVTHGHDDHIGAIPYLAKETDFDVYSTPFPRGLLENKLVEHSGLHEIRFHEVKPAQAFKVGPFTFHPIRVQHSIIESLAFAIETPVGVVIHTGDFKHDAHEIGGEVIGFEAFEEWGKKGVLLLMSDSTNAERCGHTLSERDITESFNRIFEKQTGRIIVALFASNIRRVENLLAIAHSMGKKVAFAGRSMLSYTKLAFDQNTFHIPADTLIPLEHIGKYSDKDIIVLATGSQAEPQSALVRVSQGIHKDLAIRAGDLVIMSSRFIPGNERNITGMIDHLYRQGADVLYEAIHQVHVSGHGFQDELMLMLRATRPKFFVPIHGEYRHLKKHALLAQQSGVKPENILVVEDGQSFEADENGVRLAAKIEVKKVAVVEGDLIQTTPEGFAERLVLAKTGIVFTALIRDAKTGKLLADPQVAMHGMFFREGNEVKHVVEDAQDRLEDVFEESSDRDDFNDIVRLEMRRFFKKKATHKPQVISLILDV